MVISEANFDESFSEVEFKMLFFFFGIMAFVSEGIPVKLLSAEINPTKSMFFKLNFHKNKLLVNFSYNPSRNPISGHLETSGRSLYLYSANYDNILLLGNFNVSFCDHIMEDFYSLWSQIQL